MKKCIDFAIRNDFSIDRVTFIRKMKRSLKKQVGRERGDVGSSHEIAAFGG